MKTITAVPYRRAAAHRFTAGQWESQSPEGQSPLATVLPSFDYSSILRLRREVIVDVAGLREDCGLSGSVQLLLAASWYSPGTVLRRRLAQAPIPQGDELCLVELVGNVPGSHVASEVCLDTSILVGARQDSSSPLSAKDAGAVLFRERQTIQLDESQPCFPVEVVDFGKGSWANAEAGWRLSWNVHAMEQPFLGSVRLLINAAHPRVAHAVSSETPNSEASAIRSSIYFDIARALISGALASEEFVEHDGDYARGSCGRVIHEMLQLLFPGDDVAGLAAASKQRPDYFTTDLQGRLRLFWS